MEHKINFCIKFQDNNSFFLDGTEYFWVAERFWKMNPVLVYGSLYKLWRIWKSEDF